MLSMGESTCGRQLGSANCVASGVSDCRHRQLLTSTSSVQFEMRDVAGTRLLPTWWLLLLLLLLLPSAAGGTYTHEPPDRPVSHKKRVRSLTCM